jgi:hypothetical protein
MEQNSKPEKPWYKNTWVIVIGIIIAVSFIGNLGKNSKGGSSTVGNSSSSSSEQTEQKGEEPNRVGVGQILHTNYFDITVNEVHLMDRVNTGNEFADLKPEQGIQYLIINASFKNIDKESRMLIDGSVWINYNGKDYEFDKSETVLLEGWGLLLDQINPLTTKTTNIVYKIPEEIKGNAYWQPGRADSDQKILLGNLE